MKPKPLLETYFSEYSQCLWAEEDSDIERLYHQTPDECIAGYLGDHYGEPPAEIIICAFARMKLVGSDLDPDWLLEWLLERWDEEYGDPDEATKASKAMVKAAEVFITAIAAEYRVWAHESTAAFLVNVEEWRSAVGKEGESV